MSKVPGIEVIGIAAPTCAGKTSLITELRHRMPASTATLSFDEYDLFPTGSAAMEGELAERKIANWEDPALFDIEQLVLDIGHIAQGQQVKLQARSRESLAANEVERVFTPKRTNIVEGIFVLHDARARELMDLTFYIDIPPKVMVERRLATLRPESDGNPWDDPEYIRGAMVEGTRKYVLPQRDLARVVLDGMMPTEELADVVMRALD